MRQEIPYIQFNTQSKAHFGFEIVPLERIKMQKHTYDVDPEKPHQPKFYLLLFFTAGSGRHFIDFKWHPVQKNSLIYLTKEQVNAFDFSDTTEGFCLIFTEELLVKGFTDLPQGFVSRLFNPQLFSPVLQVPENADFIAYFDLLKKEFESPEAFNKEAIIEALFTVLISKAEQLKQKETGAVSNNNNLQVIQAFNALLERYYTQTRSARFYASELAISYKHLNIICKAVLHKTAKALIDDYVILQAKRRLINSNISGGELSYELGFQDPTNFSKYFKKCTGLTPNSFKKSFQ